MLAVPLDIAPVLIVGAGPTGLAAALSLARAKLPVRIVPGPAAGPARARDRHLGAHARAVRAAPHRRALPRARPSRARRAPGIGRAPYRRTRFRSTADALSVSADAGADRDRAHPHRASRVLRHPDRARRQAHALPPGGRDTPGWSPPTVRTARCGTCSARASPATPSSRPSCWPTSRPNRAGPTTRSTCTRPTMAWRGCCRWGRGATGSSPIGRCGMREARGAKTARRPGLLLWVTAARAARPPTRRPRWKPAARWCARASIRIWRSTN